MPPGRPSSVSKTARTEGASGLKKLRSTDEEQQLILQSYLKNQKKINLDICESKTDVHLICRDGWLIPAHGVILQGVSPFFEKIFEAQGPFVMGERVVCLPDFTIDVMRHVVRLIYNEKVYLKSDAEAEEVQEAISYLQIHSSQKLSSVRSKKPAGDQDRDVAYFPKSSQSFKDEPHLPHPTTDLKSQSRVSATGEASQDKVQDKSKDSNNVQNDSDSAATEIASTTSSTRLRRTTRGSTNANQGVSATVSNGKDKDTETSGESEESEKSEEDSDDSPKSRKRRGGRKRKRVQTPTPATGSNAAGIPIKNVKVTLKKLSPSKERKPSSGPRTVVAPMRQTVTVAPAQPANKDKKKDEVDSPTDKDIDESYYKDHVWFTTQAKKCQKCKKTYDTAAEATQCLNGHSRLRCYFCFRVCKNTEQLFQHFQRAHKRAGRENFLMCPFCEQSIPFKSVSCHVISMHLSDTKKTNDGGKTGSGSTVGRPPRQYSTNTRDNKSETNPSAGSGVSGAKRVKLADDAGNKQDEPTELRVGDLHCTIKHVKKDGRTVLYNLKKFRANNPAIFT